MSAEICPRCGKELIFQKREIYESYVHTRETATLCPLMFSERMVMMKREIVTCDECKFKETCAQFMEISDGADIEITFCSAGERE
jgi:hypothetical protein